MSPSIQVMLPAAGTYNLCLHQTELSYSVDSSDNASGNRQGRENVGENTNEELIMNQTPPK